MSFWKKLFKGVGSFLGDAYNKVKKGLKIGYSFVKVPIHAINKGLHWVDHALSHTGIPIIDDTMNIVKANPLYGEVLGTINSIDHGLDIVGDMGSNIDKVVETVKDTVLQNEAGDFSLDLVRAKDIPTHLSKVGANIEQLRNKATELNERANRMRELRTQSAAVA